MRNPTSPLLEYDRGEPLFRLSVSNPERFRDVDYALHFKLFKFRRGSILACLVELFDIPCRPFYVHRVHDLSSPPILGYLNSLASGGQWRVVFESRGTMEGFSRVLRLPDAAGLRTMLGEGTAYNASIDASDGVAALARFHRIYDPLLLQSRGSPVAAWERIDAHIAGKARIDLRTSLRLWVKSFWRRG